MGTLKSIQSEPSIPGPQKIAGSHHSPLPQDFATALQPTRVELNRTRAVIIQVSVEFNVGAECRCGGFIEDRSLMGRLLKGGSRGPYS